KRPSKRKPSWIRAPLIVLGILYIIAFWPHIFQSLGFVVQFGLYILGAPGVSLAGFGHHLAIVFFTLFFGFLAVFFIWLYLISAQALLPVKKFRRYGGAAWRNEQTARHSASAAGLRPHYASARESGGWGSQPMRAGAPSLGQSPELSNFIEELRTAWHLLLYILRLHGMAVFVRDGQVLSSLKELHRRGPGVAVIDFNSAAVFEEMLPPTGLDRPFRNIILQTLIAAGLSDPLESPRARGAGIVFTRRRERIRGAVDLRRQFRLRPDVSSYTRDGIELKANVWILFTIGQEPDVLEVSFSGDPRPENLRVIKFEQVENRLFRVVDISDDLEEKDRMEIIHFFWVDNRHGQFSAYIPLEPLAPLPVFDANRVYAAVSSQARTAEEQVVPWDDLPIGKAIDSYRDIMQRANYNEFFGEHTDSPLPLALYKKKQRSAMINNGILAYRHVRHYTGVELQINTTYSQDELRVT
ncbi:MAG: hypothetical protein ROW52_11705, partial [Anaerolineaceae bacterium]